MAGEGRGSWGGEDWEPRERGDEFLRVGVLRCTENLRRGAAFDDFASVENSDAMAKGGDGQEVVGDIEDAHAEFAIELRKQAEDFGLGDGVQCAGRAAELAAHRLAQRSRQRCQPIT